MKSFREWCGLDISLAEVLGCDVAAHSLNEALIQLAPGKDSHFGNVVIMAGGAGSGKGVILNSLIDIRGKVLDVDALKVAALKLDSVSTAMQAAVGQGVDIHSPTFYKNPEHVTIAHEIISDKLGLPSRKEAALFASILTAVPERKPNLIFDVTLKDMDKLYKLAANCERLGYDKKNIHIVWVLSEMEAAYANNLSRSRTVRRDIFVKIHEGVSKTMSEIFKAGQGVLRQYVDGAIVIAFNKFELHGVSDTELTSGTATKGVVFQSKSGSKGQYIKKADYVYIKRPGHEQISFQELESRVLDKIREYVPSVTKDAWK